MLHETKRKNNNTIKEQNKNPNNKKKVFCKIVKEKKIKK